MMGRAHKLQSQLREKGLHEAGWQRDLVDGGPGNVECLVEPVHAKMSCIYIAYIFLLASHIFGLYISAVCLGTYILLLRQIKQHTCNEITHLF